LCYVGKVGFRWVRLDPLTEDGSWALDLLTVVNRSVIGQMAEVAQGAAASSPPGCSAQDLSSCRCDNIQQEG